MLNDADAIVATFEHGTSRELDPNLHTHCLFANIGLYGDGESRTLKSPILYAHKMVAGALYRSVLARELRSIGFELEAEKTWFEIKGIGQDTREHFSKRRASIVKSAGEFASSKALDRATLETRSVKGHVARNQLFPQWQEDARQFGISPASLRNSLSKSNCLSKSERQRAERTLAKSLEELAEVDSVHEKRHVLRTMLEKAQTGDLDAQTLIDVLDEAIETGGLLESIGRSASMQTEYLTSAQIRESERKILESAENLMRDDRVHGDRNITENVLSGGLSATAKQTVNALVDQILPELLRFKFAAPEYDKLSQEQRDAVLELTTKRSKLNTVRGVAGSGKTTMLAAAREAWEAHGYKVVGCALSGSAAQELAKGSGINSETIRMTLIRLEPDRIRRLKHDARMLVRAFLKKKTFQYDQMKLDGKTVLVVDEASMVGTKDMASLLRHAEKAGARVVLVGDTRQLPSIKRGGAFEKIHEEVKGPELTTSVRQKNEWLKSAVQSANEGDIRGALAVLSHEKRLVLTKSEKDSHERLIEKWASERTDDLSETLILASKNDDVSRLNIAAQDERRRRGELGEAKFTWNGVTYRTEDRVTFHEIDRKLGIWNGSAGTIRGITEPINASSARFEIELDSGETVSIAPGELKSKDAMSLGYAATVHKAQGKTVDKTFLLIDDEMVNRQSAYVGLTRSRHDAFVFAQAECVDEDSEELDRLVRRAERDKSKVFASTHERNLHEREQEIRNEAESSKIPESQRQIPLVQEISL